MFIWNQKKHAINCNGVLLLTQPETGARWKSEAQALQWWQTSEFNPDSQVAKENRAEPMDERTAVNITDISDVVRKPADISELELINITATEGKDIVLTGELAIEDEDFVVPFRRDDGRTLYFPIVVKNGQFRAILNFPTSGRYQIDSQSLNAEFTTPRFTTKTLVIFVLRPSSAAVESSTANNATVNGVTANGSMATRSATKSLINTVLGK